MTLKYPIGRDAESLRHKFRQLAATRKPGAASAEPSPEMERARAIQITINDSELKARVVSFGTRHGTSPILRDSRCRRDCSRPDQ
jgi:hypothetical protein